MRTLLRPDAAAARMVAVVPRLHRLSRRPEPAALTLIALAGLALRLLAIRQSYWYDEALTVEDVRLGFSHMIATVVTTETTPPGYFVLAWVWVRVFGSGEVELRLLSVLCGVALIPVAYLACKALFSRAAGLAAALLVAVNPFLIWYSQEARSYALFALVGALSFWTFVRARRSWDSRWLALWALSSSCALLVHHFALFLILGEALWLLVPGRRRRAVWLAAGSVAVTGLAIAPVIVVQQQEQGLSWIPSIPLGKRLTQVPGQFAAGLDSPHHVLAIAVALALVVLAVAWAAWRGDARYARGAVLAGSVGLAVVAVPLMLAALGTDYLVTRNVIVAWLPLAAVVAGGLTAVRARLPGLLVLGALCGLGVLVTASVASDPTFQRASWRELASVLGRPARTRLVVLGVGYRALAMLLYLHGAELVPPRAVRVRELDVVGIRSQGRRKAGSAVACWWGSECNLPAARPRSAPPSARFVRIGSEQIGQFMVVRFRTARFWAVRGGLPPRLAGRLFRRPRPGQFLLLQRPAPRARAGRLPGRANAGHGPSPRVSRISAGGRRRRASLPPGTTHHA